MTDVEIALVTVIVVGYIGLIRAISEVVGL